MNIRKAAVLELSRIREIDRTEEIETTYHCRLAPDARSIEMIEVRSDPASLFENWNEEGVRRRVRWWTRELEKGGAIFFAEADDRLVGIAILGPERSGHCAEILALFIDRTHRRQGLGTQLMMRLEDEARSQGLASLCVHSNENANALDFYQHAGYRIVCLMDPSITWVPALETCIVLAKKL